MDKEIIKIGIDPDTEKSGVAVFNIKSRELKLYNLRFFELMDFLKNTSALSDIKEVVIEAGFLNKSNWHIKERSVKYNAQIGQRTGANHETAKKIIEMCEYLQINHRIVKPTKSKINAQTFKKITNYQNRTNQEVRDAAMLVFG